ncbi:MULTISPECIES: hypothetical protein [Caballeronia]|nr:MULTISPECIES: hypothetical protein [Caballeronia]MDR5795884.1 hypothetical protein [Caballeronia sp. LZ008]
MMISIVMTIKPDGSSKCDAMREIVLRAHFAKLLEMLQKPVP